MQRLFFSYGEIITTIAAVIALIACFLFNNAFIIAFFISLFWLCLYLLFDMKKSYHSPHKVIEESINRLAGCRFGKNSEKIDKFIGLLYSLDAKISTLQNISGPNGSKREYQSSCNEYIEKALNVVKTNSERLSGLCSLEEGSSTDDLINQVVERVQQLLRIMDDLIMSFSNIGYKNDAEILQMIKDYADSLDELN